MPDDNVLMPFPDQIQRSEESGPESVSPKGAMGTMQVMPGTALDPGFGVTPAMDFTPNELDRVGRDYANALLTRYGGSRMLAAVAYNAGPARADQWIKEFGDPRTGAISEAEWANKIPIAETKKYAAGYVGQGALGQGAPAKDQGFGMAQINDMMKGMEGAGTGAGTVSPLSSLGRANPAVALQLMQMLLPRHKLTPVDYDPWKVAKAAQPMTGTVNG